MASHVLIVKFHQFIVHLDRMKTMADSTNHLHNYLQLKNNGKQSIHTIIHTNTSHPIQY